MSKYQIVKTSVHEESLFLRSGDSLGMDLGELRAIVLAAAGLSPDSQVRVGRIKDSLVEGEKFVGEITIRERSKAS